LGPGNRPMDRAVGGAGRPPVPLDRAPAARRAGAHGRRRHLRRLPVGRLPAPRHGALHAALPVPQGRQRPPPPTSARHRRTLPARPATSAASTSPATAPPARVAPARLAAPTHSQAQSRRSAPLSFTQSGTTVTAAAPNNPNEAPAGHYMLFAVDTNGVPSQAP